MVYLDSRFWFPKSPGIQGILKAKSNAESVEKLIAFLEEEKQDGFDCIAVPYLLVKMTQEAQWSGCPWLEAANKNYGNITSQTTRGPPALKNEPVSVHRYTREGGITLSHQPGVIRHPDFKAGERPSSKYVPNLAKTTETTETAFRQGVPWASGVSGSTNIALYALDYFKNSQPPIDARDYFLSTMMFLTYDGGHSLHEAMWTANQVQKQGGLALNMPLSDEADPKHFVADYERLKNLYSGKDAFKAMEDAMKYAERTMLDYFEKHSFFATDEERRQAA